MVKKLLFTFALTTVAASVFPQNNVLRAPQSPKKAAQKSVYYLKPEGALFEATPKSGSMVGTSYLYVPGYSETKFTKVAPEGTEIFWHQNLYDMYGTCTTFDRTDKTGLNYASDNEGNFYITSVFNGSNVLPTIVSETDSFTLSEENPHWGPLDYDIPAVMYWYPQIKSGTLSERESFLRPLQFVDDHIDGYTLGFLSTGYLYGSGTVEDGDVYTSRGVQQICEKPMAPLWVEDVFLPSVSTSATPLAGKELTMLITNVETDEYGRKTPGTEILAELTCDASSLEELEAVQDEDGTTYNRFSAVFKPEEKGFLIDQEFAVVVTGFDQQGVSLGLMGSEIPYYNNMRPVYSLLTADDGTKFAANIYGDNNIALAVTFTAKFDYANGYVDITEAGDYNYGLVQMNDEGTEGQTIISGGTVFSGAVAQVNGNWFEDGEEQYTLSGLADWIKSYNVDDESYKYAGLTVISFETEPLPAGVTGRRCDILITGKGVVSNKPLTVVQGDLTTGIGNVEANTETKDAPKYNTAGQLVGKSHKGIVIENGKKHVIK